MKMVDLMDRTLSANCVRIFFVCLLSNVHRDLALFLPLHARK